MKNFGKCMGILIFYIIVCLGFVVKADTGNINTGIIYTGTLTGYIQAQENIITTLFEAAYTKAYTTFEQTGLNIIKSIEYQSLVCLGALKDQNIFVKLQQEKTAFKVAFSRDFVELEKKIQGLEEKKIIQEEDNINMFDPGTTYESEKARLKDEIDKQVQQYIVMITNFSNTYASNTAELITTFQQYLVVNQQLINNIKTNMTKVQSVVLGFAEIESGIQSMYTKITGLDDLMQKMTDAKVQGIENLDKVMQQLIDANIKKYKKIKNLMDGLTAQKTYILNQYQTDFDKYINDNLQLLYDRSQYLTLKDQINTFKTKYYTNTNQFNCANILSTSNESVALLTKISAMKIAINSGSAKVGTDTIITTFKDQLVVSNHYTFKNSNKDMQNMLIISKHILLHH